MALGLPVIASAVNGTPEAVRDGETGYLFPSGDAAALAGRMKELIDDAEARERLGRRGRAVARDEFGAARMIDGLLLVYQAVADQRPLPASTGPRELR
jgi:colanic acid/amylovoran biosynthesis glycosyltransferase